MRARVRVRPTGRHLPVRPCVDRRIALELAGTACVVECAQVEVGRDALLGDVLRGDGEEYGAQVGDGLDEEAGELEDDALEDGRATTDGPGFGLG